jgi:hypothetical protein
MKGDFKSLMRLLMRHLPKLDLYGGAVRTDPARFPKSHIGAVVSLICFGAAIALIAINASRLYTAAAAARDDGLSTIVSMGTEYIKFNAFFEDPDTGQLTGVDDGRWDLPSLMIECSSNIEFFNRDARKLYKIELRDNSGIHRGLTSSKQSTPVASGLYKRVPVALGSVNQDLEPGVGEKQASVSLAASLGFKKLHSGQEIIRVLKKMKNGTQEFFDHKAHAFVRLLPWQMQSVKSCQLQVRAAQTLAAPPRPTPPHPAPPRPCKVCRAQLPPRLPAGEPVGLADDCHDAGDAPVPNDERRVSSVMSAVV